MPLPEPPRPGVYRGRWPPCGVITAVPRNKPCREKRADDFLRRTPPVQTGWTRLVEWDSGIVRTRPEIGQTVEAFQGIDMDIQLYDIGQGRNRLLRDQVFPFIPPSWPTVEDDGSFRFNVDGGEFGMPWFQNQGGPGYSSGGSVQYMLGGETYEFGIKVRFSENVQDQLSMGVGLPNKWWVVFQFRNHPTTVNPADNKFHYSLWATNTNPVRFRVFQRGNLFDPGFDSVFTGPVINPGQWHNILLRWSYEENGTAFHQTYIDNVLFYDNPATSTYFRVVHDPLVGGVARAPLMGPYNGPGWIPSLTETVNVWYKDIYLDVNAV